LTRGEAVAVVEVVEVGGEVYRVLPQVEVGPQETSGS